MIMLKGMVDTLATLQVARPFWERLTEGYVT